MPKKEEKKQNVQPRHNQFAAIEEEILEFWRANNCFEKSIEQRPVDKQYTFYDGPPFATGLPHYGHIVASLIKDMVPRHWTMRGYRVERRWGWDCHGLPMENIIEKELGLSGRNEIEAYGVERFNEACRTMVLKYADEWKRIIPRMGRWVDMENAYRTMDTSFTESVWWVFSELWKKGLIYEGRKAMHVCPRCVTPLSNFEVTLGYKDVDDLAVTWKFRLRNADADAAADEPNTFLLAWTTTPWSTPGTTGVSVGPNHTYVKARVGDEIVIVVKERVEEVLKDVEYKLVGELKGSDLVGRAYDHIVDFYRALPEVAQNPGMYHVYPADYVEVTEGTGIVTINGSYGEVDMEQATTHGLPLIMDVDMDGRFNSRAGFLAGMDVKAGQEKLVEDARGRGVIWKTELYRHSYPHCWRCDTALLNYATSSWFVRVTELKEQLRANNQKIRWVPEHVKDGRFGKWLENARDWAISRTRFWGAPLPVWRNVNDPADVLCVSSVAELEGLTGEQVTDLHKHKIDHLVIRKDGKEYRRIPEVLDCWFESGAMPYGQAHYPFENRDQFAHHFPAQFIAEGQDQTRGWFYTLHVLATALTSGAQPSIAGTEESTPAFQNVIVNGIVLAEDGKKMSKRLQNYPDPMLIAEKYGADSLRMYLASSLVMESENLNFTEQHVDEIHRKYINTLWNVVTFYHLFADNEERAITEIVDAAEATHVLDQWILAKLAAVVAEVTEGYDTYRLRQAAAPLEDFVQELSTWYVRRSRNRCKGSDAADRVMALRTLYTVLKTLSKIGAPVTPFITEKIYQGLRTGADPISVHLCDWPAVSTAFQNVDALTTMQQVRDAIETVLSMRAQTGIKVRQPLQSATIVGLRNLSPEYVDVLKEELNVKEIRGGDEYALDTVLTEELRMEGALRELVRHTNALRKKSRLSIQDVVVLRVHTGSPILINVLQQYREELERHVLARAVEMSTEPQEHRFSIDGEELTLSLSIAPER